MALRWISFSHPKNKKLKAIVAYHDFGNLKDVRVIIPLYDLRDADLDGKVGWGEAIFPWLPIVGSSISPMQQTQLMAHVAAELNDPGMTQLVRSRMLGTGFKIADKAFRAITLKRLAGASIGGLLDAAKLTEVSKYVVKKAYSGQIFKLLGAS